MDLPAPDVISPVVERALALIAETGRITDAALRDALLAEGFELPDPDDRAAVWAFEDELTERSTWGLGDWWATEAFLGHGRVATRRVTAAEVEADYLVLEPDLLVLHFAVHLDDTRAVPGGEATVTYLDGATSPTGVAVGVLEGPAGWLAGLGAGDLVALTLGADELHLETDVEVADDDADLVALLAEGFAAHRGDDGVAESRTVVGLAVVARPELFEVARRPLTELLADAGIEVEGDELAALGFDWEALWESRRDARAQELEDELGLDAIDARMFGDIAITMVRHGHEVLDDEAWEQAAAALCSPGVTEALAGDPFGRLGLFATDESVAELRAFVEELLARTPSRPPAGALVLLGRCHLEAGDLEAHELAATAALRADPDSAAALFDSAVLAATRGQASRALGYFDRAGLSGAGYPDLLRTFAAPGPTAAGRNDPCPCGSGRKHKVCCGPRNGHPIRARAVWLYEKAAVHANLAPARRDRIPFACAAVGVESIQDDPDLVAVALTDENLTDLHLFDGGWLGRFADAAGPLLPEDERALLATWLDRHHRVWVLDDVPVGAPWTVRDAATGEVHVVLDLPGAPDWEVGEHLFGVVVPIDDQGTEALMGGIRLLTDAQAAAAVELLRTDGDVVDLAQVVVGPVLAATLAANQALLDGGWDDRVEWLFPGDELAPDELDDDELLVELCAEHHFPDMAGMALDDSTIQAVQSTVVAARQVLALDPPEVWDTVRRLVAGGATTTQALVLVASEVLGRWQADPEAGPASLPDYLDALRRLG